VPRPPRDEGPGAIHHVVAQGSGRQRIVLDDRDRVSFVTRFAEIQRELGWLTHATCLMDTHFHGVIETPEPNLGLGMQRLQGGHSRWFNRRHGREGHVFRHRYWSKRITDERWLLRACLYVVANPVAADLCAHPRDWPWSSYRRTAEGDAEAFDVGEELLLEALGATPLEARRAYAAEVDSIVHILSEWQPANDRPVWESLASGEGLEVPG
jgi:putative transposase